MGVTLTFDPAADEHGIPHEETMWVMANGQWWDDWEEARPPFGPSRLWIGPSRFGTLEVMAELTPPRDIHVFHSMPLRQTTADKVGYKRED